MRIAQSADIATLDFSKGDGLLPVAVQHYATGELLMMGFVDEEAVRRSFEGGELWLYSRSRGEHWHKGATSGHTQRVISIHTDCDRDAILIRVDPNGPTCHTGARSCFDAPPTLRELADVIDSRIKDPAIKSYTARLLEDANLRTKKLGEEAVELAVACATNQEERVIDEAADLLYHVLVSCAGAGVTLDQILAKLHQRRNSNVGI